MDLEKFRHTGELSDITVIVDGTEFKLHTFPLMIKSEYFKKAVASSTTAAPYVIRLDNEFPGGVQVFNQLADYFYSIPIAIDQKNLVALRSAARFTESHALETSINKRLDEMLLLARAKCDISSALALLEHCKGEYQTWAKQTGIVRKCLECIVGSSTCGVSLPFSKADRDLIDHLPLEWMVELIGLTEKKLAILPLVKHYLSVHVMHQSQPTNSTPREEGSQESAFAPVMRHEDLSETTDDEKRETLDQIVNALGRTLEQMPLAWLHAAYEKAVELKCNCQSILSSCITQVILHSAYLDREMKNLPDDVMDKLFERISQHREEHSNDTPMLAKLSSWIDLYIDQLRQRGTLTSEQFIKLASCIPKEQRSSHNSLLLALNDMFKEEKSRQWSTSERETLLSQIDFSRVNEETINACKDNEHIPQKIIADAALALCAKMRCQLVETENRLRTVEYELAKSRPTFNSSAYRSRHRSSSTRFPTRSRIIYLNSYDLPSVANSTYDWYHYDSDSDPDHALPSDFSSAVSRSRYETHHNHHY